MKKLLSFVLLAFGLVFLVSCGDLFGEKRNEVEMTVEEMQALVDKVDFAVVANDVLVLETDIDIKANIINSSALSEEDVEVGFEVKGSLGIYANLKSFEESYIYANVDLSYELTGDISQLMEDQMDDPFNEGETLPIDISQFMSGSFEGKIYIIKGVLYLNAKVTYPGTTLEVKQYEQIFTEEEFDMMKAIIENGFINEEQNNSFDIATMPEDLDLTVYKVGDSYEFEMKTPSEIEEMINNLMGFALEYEELNVDIIKNTSFDNSMTIRFSDKLEKISLNSKTDVHFKVSNTEASGESVEVKLFTEVNFSFNFKGKMPKNLPTEDDFTDYVQGIDLN